MRTGGWGRGSGRRRRSSTARRSHAWSSPSGSPWAWPCERTGSPLSATAWVGAGGPGSPRSPSAGGAESLQSGLPPARASSHCRHQLGSRQRGHLCSYPLDQPWKRGSRTGRKGVRVRESGEREAEMEVWWDQEISEIDFGVQVDQNWDELFEIYRLSFLFYSEDWRLHGIRNGCVSISTVEFLPPAFFISLSLFQLFGNG